MLFAKAVFFLICVTQLAYGYPDGADSAACFTMLPVHDQHTPQTSAAPFTVTTSAASVSPGQQLNVFITRTNTVHFLRGFMIQARNPAGAAVGQFLPTPGMRLMTCAPVGSTATHTSAANIPSITLTWVPPPTGFTGNVVFT